MEIKEPFFYPYIWKAISVSEITFDKEVFIKIVYIPFFDLEKNEYIEKTDMHYIYYYQKNLEEMVE